VRTPVERMRQAMNPLFSSGYVRLGRLRRAPVRVHWTTPLGLFVFSGFSFDPLVWAALLLVMVVHEIGHAVLARRYDLHVVSIDVTGVGGVCRVAGDPTLTEAAVVAWGGVLAQAALLVAAIVVRSVLHFVTAGLLDGVFDTLITTNVVLMVLNLLPIEPLDGATAWRLFTR
jgi:stage IV sporulation protein FB